MTCCSVQVLNRIVQLLRIVQKKSVVESRSRLEEAGFAQGEEAEERGWGAVEGGRSSLGCLLRTSLSSTSGSDISELISHIWVV